MSDPRNLSWHAPGIGLSRRALLQLALAQALGSAVIAAPRSGSAPALLIYDGRIPRSRAFGLTPAPLALDVAQQEADAWRRLRAWSAAGPVSGLTRWSDYLQARGALQHRGLRVRSEHRQGELIQWEMS
ncbi:MAG TPA: hypothetical protein VME21_02360 [Steroidobacteraceae bacterium]|nr:hypothetical protein [Steroidobacteraceae bacterium]